MPSPKSDNGKPSNKRFAAVARRRSSLNRTSGNQRPAELSSGEDDGIEPAAICMTNEHDFGHDSGFHGGAMSGDSRMGDGYSSSASSSSGKSDF